ncbi:unnamed protein product [Gadus morhua 'NCC']
MSHSLKLICPHNTYQTRQHASPSVPVVSRQDKMAPSPPGPLGLVTVSQRTVGNPPSPRWPRDEAPSRDAATASMTHCCLPREDNREDALTPLGWSWWRGSNLHHVV